jgi:hypothetical protein
MVAGVLRKMWKRKTNLRIGDLFYTRCRQIGKGFLSRWGKVEIDEDKNRETPVATAGVS